jgi:hypothetical protein
MAGVELRAIKASSPRRRLRAWKRSVLDLAGDSVDSLLVLLVLLVRAILENKSGDDSNQ